MKKAVSWLLCAVWMSVIFIMSAMPGDVSGEQSGMIVRWILRAAEQIFGTSEMLCAETLALIVRKAAHMGEYAVLWLLYARALAVSGAERPRLTALFLSVFYAATDEFHQGFIAGRGPSAMDVCIDALGAAAAWGTSALAEKTRKKEH